ncbi:SHD1 domain-containing protein [Rhodopirellula sallentina]|uniref:SHD1 domain-containing protein n=1 Tax=Rhodopirellula sallentina TaxID=1263869 RepID=UPI0005C7C0F1|nr:SHD1 domain-containing protein [Rhodopirellula sallentina]
MFDNLLQSCSVVGQQNSEVAAWIFPILIGAVLAGLGIYAIYHAIVEQTEAGKARYRRDSMAAYGYVKPPIPVYKSGIAAGIGVALILGGGIFVIAMGGKSDRRQAASVNPASPQSPLSQNPSPPTTTDANADQYEVDVPDASITTSADSSDPAMDSYPSANVKSEEDQPPISGNASARYNPNRRDRFRSRPTEPANPDSSNRETSGSMASGVSNDEPSVDNSGEIKPSVDDSSEFPNREAPRATPQELRPVKRYAISIPLPPGAVVVSDDAPIVVGTRLGAVWARKWNYVTVTATHGDGTLDVKWDNWNTEYRMVREDLAIAKSDLETLQRQAIRNTAKEPRLWSDASGKFKVMATYVDAKDGFVSLRKEDGREVSVPVSKLSEGDQELIETLSKN